MTLKAADRSGGRVHALELPVNQTVRKLSAALAAGCSIIVKAPAPPPAAPAELLGAFVDAGVTAGVVTLVSGAPAEISECENAPNSDPASSRICRADFIAKMSVVLGISEGTIVTLRISERAAVSNS